MLGADSWAGAAEEAGSRRRGAGDARVRPRDRVRRRRQADRHDRVVQPLGGGLRVAYSGEPGAFAEDAVLRFFAGPEALALSSFRAVFEAVRDGDADAGVVPVENSLLGTIRETSTCCSFELPIDGEVSVPVRLALPRPARRDARRRSSACTRSRPALAQADEFLRSRPWSVQTTYNTAGAAKVIAERRERGAAAVASARVAGHLRPGDARRRHPGRQRQPHPVRGDRAARRGRAGHRGRATGRGRRPAADDRSCSASATCRARSTARSGSSRAAGSTCRGSSRGPDGARVALGVRVLGGPRRRPGGRDVCGGPRGARATETEWSASSARTGGPPRTDARAARPVRSWAQRA